MQHRNGFMTNLKRSLRSLLLADALIIQPPPQSLMHALLVFYPGHYPHLSLSSLSPQRRPVVAPIIVTVPHLHCITLSRHLRISRTSYVPLSLSLHLTRASNTPLICASIPPDMRFHCCQFLDSLSSSLLICVLSDHSHASQLALISNSPHYHLSIAPHVRAIIATF